MHLRFTVLLAATLLLVLMLPTASLAAISWKGTGGTFDTRNGWTHSTSVQLTYEALLQYTEKDVNGLGNFEVTVVGDVTMPSYPFLPDQQDSNITLTDPALVTATCSGDVSVPLTPNDGEKLVMLQFLYTAVDYNSIDGMVTLRSPVYKGAVTLDTRGPKTIAPYPLSCRKNGYATITYQADDALSPTVKVSLSVMNAKGKKVAKASLGEQETGKVLSYLWRCPLGPGKYKYSILATDLAGNKAAKAGRNTLTVK